MWSLMPDEALALGLAPNGSPVVVVTTALMKRYKQNIHGNRLWKLVSDLSLGDTHLKVLPGMVRTSWAPLFLLQAS